MLRAVQRSPLLSVLLIAGCLFLLWRSRAQIESNATWTSRLHLPNTQHILSPEEAFKEKDGLLYLQDHARPGANPQNIVNHPILYLMEKAKTEWKKKVDGQSKDLWNAVQNYKQKYGIPPPRGFDKWYKFAKENKVILLDSYDQIHRDILPFLGLPSKPIRDRSRVMIEDVNNYYYQGSFTLWIKGGKVAKITGGEKDHHRVQEQIGLMQGFVHLLPDMNVTIWTHDTSVMHMTGEKRVELESLARQRKTLPQDRWEDWGDPPEFVGWEAFCEPNSNMRKAFGGLASRQPIPHPSFITQQYESSDFCRHPDNLPLHSLTGNYGIGPRAVNLWPLFSQSKLSLYADILVTPLEQYGMQVGNDPDWEKKSKNKIVWRGSSTGSKYAREIIWRSAQRSRLTLLTNSKSTNITSTVYTTAKDNTTLQAYEASLAHLNPRFYDIIFTGGPIQCEQNDGSCEAVARHLPFTEKGMNQDQANQYKYVFDVDGNGWSGRFHRLMSTKQAVLKSTGFTEWWGDRIQPWLHYIPVKMDYTDLHSIASFFIGDEHSSGHDALGKEIGLAGKDWAENHFRMADMEAYMFRLYLEYARLLTRDEDDPRNMDYRG